jgi:hypothetical protein
MFLIRLAGLELVTFNYTSIFQKIKLLANDFQIC